MILAARWWWKSWQQVRVFLALKPRARSIVFYAEDAASWVHLEAIIRELTGPMGREICYLTSDSNDPILQSRQPRIRSFYIGEGPARTWLFLNLRASVMVMTMPDLETFHIKRSRVHPVHYVYLFHSMVSTHMIYRKGAFDHYDTVLCVGPHHLQEIRANEAAVGLKPKRLIPHGFGRLEALMHERARRAADRPKLSPAVCRVLVAPSWGPQALLESCGKDLVRTLIDAGYQVTVRPHPMTQRKHPELMHALKEILECHPHSTLETDVASQESLYASDIMISDWSGAALEYAFAMERPVLFIDVPKKVNNPDYTGIPSEPLEVTIRKEIGAVVEPRCLSEVPQQIELLCTAADQIRVRIQALRDRMVFNVGTSGTVGAREIVQLADACMGPSVPQAMETLDELFMKIVDEAPLKRLAANRWPVEEALLRLVWTSAKPPDDQRRRDLDSLCRYVARVQAEYQRDRSLKKVLSGSQEIPSPLWSLVSAVLLSCASAGPEGGRLDRGLSLKCLNAACGALEVTEAFDHTTHLVSLRAWQETLLVRVGEE